MAAKEKLVTDTLWEDMKSLAVEKQQCFYELLPDCTIYEFSEYKYLRQNIGYAVYGPPTRNEDATNTAESSGQSCYGKENTNDETADITDTVDYDEEARNVINTIYNRICECALGTDQTQPIYFGVIYNVIVCSNTCTKKKKKIKEKVKETAGNEIEVEEEKVLVLPIPVFTIRKPLQSEKIQKSNIASSTKQENALTKADYEIWYIDTSPRVYKSWSDYTGNNNLQECVMVLPKDGFYQPDPGYPIEEDYSTVWIEIMDSPACALSTKICNTVDVVSSVVGIGALGLGIASVFTPIGPIVAVTSLAATSATGAWTFGRCSQQLIDRSIHEESINPLDKQAFPHWLGLAGSAAGLGAVGGSAAISTAAARGMTVPMYARVAFNTVQGGNLLLNGIGIAYMGYNMIEKYRSEQSFSYLDALNLATHIMFFAGSVVNVQFAGDIIETTQGRVINDYKKSLRNKNLRKKFNRTVRKAAENNTSKISENAEVIRYIKNRQELLSVNQSAAGSNTSDRTSDRASGKGSDSTSNKTSDSSSSKTSDRTSNVTSDKTSDGSTNKTSDRAPDSTSEKVSDKASSKASDNTSSKTADKTSNKTSGKTVDRTDKTTGRASDSTTNNTSDKVPGKTSDKASDRISDSTSDKISGKSSDKTSGKTLETASDKVSVKNADTPLDKNSDSISNKTSDRTSDSTPSKISGKSSGKNSSKTLDRTSDSIADRTLDKTSYSTSIWSFDQGKLRVGNIILLDPIEFAKWLIESGALFETFPDQSNPSDFQDNANNSSLELTKVLQDLLTELCKSDDLRSMPKISDFEPLLRNLSSMNISEDDLKKLFAIAVQLIRRSRESMKDLLLTALTFVSQYCKTNLRQWGINSRYRMQSDSGSYILRKIVFIVFQAIEMILDNLFQGFAMYLLAANLI